MASIETRPSRKGQQFLTRVLRAAQSKRQKAVGEAIGWNESRTSRVLSGEQSITLEEALDLVAECDLAVIDAPNGDTVTVSRSHYNALVTLASERAVELQGMA